MELGALIYSLDTWKMSVSSFAPQIVFKQFFTVKGSRPELGSWNTENLLAKARNSHQV